MKKKYFNYTESVLYVNTLGVGIKNYKKGRKNHIILLDGYKMKFKKKTKENIEEGIQMVYGYY